MTSQSVGTIADIEIPDTPLVRAITEYIRDAEDDLLFDHSRRVFLFGALQGRRRGLQPDLELLYAAAMFHDLGLNERYGTSQLRFEVDSANAAREFLLKAWCRSGRREQGVAGHCFAHHSRRSRIPGTRNRFGDSGCRDRRARHRPRRPVGRGPRGGHRRPPAPDFKNRILAAFNDGMKHRPHSTFGTVNADVLQHFDPEFVRDNFVEIIRTNTWPE